jgi:hypothetical protein
MRPSSADGSGLPSISTLVVAPEAPPTQHASSGATCLSYSPGAPVSSPPHVARRSGSWSRFFDISGARPSRATAHCPLRSTLVCRPTVHSRRQLHRITWVTRHLSYISRDRTRTPIHHTIDPTKARPAAKPPRCSASGTPSGLEGRDSPALDSHPAAYNLDAAAKESQSLAYDPHSDPPESY